jgi:hypothetical protein
MSLIVDINPVPWEILELVKARILKNRAKRQPQEQLGELKRAMSLRPGPLSRKRREEEPSFILSGGTPYIAFLVNGDLVQNGTTVVNAYSGTGYDDGRFITAYQNWSQPGPHTFKLNGVVVGDIVPPGAINTWVAYLFVWTDDIATQQDLVNNDAKTFMSGIYYDFEFIAKPIYSGYDPSGASYIPEKKYLVVFDWVIVAINKDKLAEPSPGDTLKAELIPQGIGLGSLRLCFGVAEDNTNPRYGNVSTWNGGSPFLGNKADPGIAETRSFDIKIPIDPS